MSACCAAHTELTQEQHQLHAGQIDISPVAADNVAIDSTVSEDNDDFPTDFGTESKPCNYPLLSGKTS